MLIGGQPVPSELLEIPVDAIHPNPRQPRRRFEAEAASGLAESVRREGIIQPLLVRPRGIGGYEIVAGERRWRAAREAGRETVPAVVRAADDRETLLLGLVENVAREQLTPIEEARAYAVLIDEFSLSLGEVAERVGRSKPSVSNRIRLLELPDDVLGMVERAQLTEGHARAVLAAGSRARSCVAVSRCGRRSSGPSGPAPGSDRARGLLRSTLRSPRVRALRSST
jgi:ParB family chromosome partitioning protein